MASTINFIDPRAEPSAPAEMYRLELDLTEAGLTIGLLANGFPDSVKFLDSIEAALREQHGDVLIQRYDKGDPTISAPGDLIEQMAADCSGVIAAYGH